MGANESGSHCIFSISESIALTVAKLIDPTRCWCCVRSNGVGNVIVCLVKCWFKIRLALGFWSQQNIVITTYWKLFGANCGKWHRIILTQDYPEGGGASPMHSKSFPEKLSTSCRIVQASLLFWKLIKYICTKVFSRTFGAFQDVLRATKRDRFRGYCSSTALIHIRSLWS